MIIAHHMRQGTDWINLDSSVTKKLDHYKVWYDKLTYKFGFLFYYTNLDKLYFYPVSNIFTKEDLESYKSMKQIKLTEDFLIT